MESVTIQNIDKTAFLVGVVLAFVGLVCIVSIFVAVCNGIRYAFDASRERAKRLDGWRSNAQN